MELKDFISESVKQVLAGVREAQGSEDGGNINAKLTGKHELGGNLIDAGLLGVISRIDFEVEVAAESSGGGGAKITVMGVFGAEGSGKHMAKSANKLTFSIPVLLPSGSDEPADRARRKSDEQMDKTNQGLAELVKGLT